MDGRHYLEETRKRLAELKSRAERALEQVDDAQFFAQLDAESNSLAIVVKHLGGNLRSRWRDFLTSDGEKADRRRDFEFVLEPGDTRASLMERWEAGWRYLLDTLSALKPEALERKVIIRCEPHTVVEAMQRAYGHAAEHVGQIFFLARHLAGPRWKTLSIPRGRSEEFNAMMRGKRKERRTS